MIIRPKKRLEIMFIMQGSFIRQLWRPLLALFLFSCLVSFYHGLIADYDIKLNTSVFTLLGIALAIFLGFCNNAAYDRFWEARKLWGSLILVSRSLARQILSLSKHDSVAHLKAQQEAIPLVVAFAYALKHQLRGSDAKADLRRLLPEATYLTVIEQPFWTMNILYQLGLWLATQRQMGWIDSIQWQAIDANLNELSHIQAGCERIHNTPIPFAYFVLMERTVYWYCFLLPFGLIGAIGWITPIMVTFVGYTFMALSAVVDEISDPFGTDENDLALAQMCHTIEQQLRQSAHLPRADFEIETAPRYIVR